METLTIEHFQAQLDAEERSHESNLFDALHALRQTAFIGDDLLDGIEEELSGWNLWW